MNKLGYSVTVVEIAKGLRKGGTPVNIRDGVIDVVRRMNLLERIKSESLPPRPMTFLDAHGSPLPLALSQAEEEPEEEYEIERDALLDMLFGEVRDHVEFLFADSISGLEQSADEVAVTFASGTGRPLVGRGNRPTCVLVLTERKIRAKLPLGGKKYFEKPFHLCYRYTTESGVLDLP
ncbi:MAG: hypothetical protein WDN23_13070 [Edaphobacter sp.]